MTSNFRNAAGTDLDDVFYVSNSSAGAIGFKCSNGQDLGDRYPAGSLGANVGYKNSAGTDIGYLRTKMVAPTGSLNMSVSTTKEDIASYSYIDTSGDGGNYVTCTRWRKWIDITVRFSSSNGQPVTAVNWSLELNPAFDSLVSTATGGASVTNPPDFAGGGTCNNMVYEELCKSSQFKMIKNYANGATGVFKISCMGHTNKNKPNGKIRVKAYAYNSVGGTTVYSSEASY